MVDRLIRPIIFASVAFIGHVLCTGGRSGFEVGDPARTPGMKQDFLKRRTTRQPPDGVAPVRGQPGRRVLVPQFQGITAFEKK
jgi:hypothetical protein